MLFMPAGYFHAVLTTKPTVAVGGNILSLYNIEKSFQIYYIQKIILHLTGAERGDGMMLQLFLLLRDLVLDDKKFQGM